MFFEDTNPGLPSDVKGGGGERVPWHRGKPVLCGAWLHIWGVIIVKTDRPCCVVTHLGRYYCQNRLPVLYGYAFGALLVSKQTARVAWLHIWGIIIIIVKTDCLISLSCCSSGLVITVGARRQSLHILRNRQIAEGGNLMAISSNPLR